MANKQIFQSVLIVSLSCLLGVFALFFLTRDNIATAQIKLQENLLKSVLKKVNYDNDLLASKQIFNGTNAIYTASYQGKIVAYVVTATAHNGYNGDINFVMSVDKFNNILALEITSHKETPGLGDKIEASKSSFLQQFAGKNLKNANFNVKKKGGDFDSFAGATITPNAVIVEVKNVLERLQNSGK
jgi:electron transport complex protein RnfG